MNRRLTILILLILSTVFFSCGLIYPILATKKQMLGIVLSYKEVKLFDSILLFYKSGDYFLALIILVFTILFPSLKYLDLFNRLFNIRKFSEKVGRILKILDKWSMLDVFLVALLLLNFKMDSNIIVMKLKIGTNFIALAVIFRMTASHLLSYWQQKNI